ncbi:EboA domain-containing protein [Actinoplanes sp. NPDC023714]|uniref:EboA domain-containing protein n=1 Tax=Actinoplanes sp. NPDC023714 TaxID=3154322 RepID=UPI0033EF77B3
MTDLKTLRAALSDSPWLTEAVTAIEADPKAIGALFPAAGRRCGRGAIAPGWTADEAARAIMLAAAPAEADDLYRYGDADEKRAVLKSLPLLPIGDAAVPLLHDALRTNDTRLVAAALGPYAAHLDPAAWRQAVLKCVFMGIPLDAVDSLHKRADAALAAMLRAFADERAAAGREVPADAQQLLDELMGA